MAKKIFISYSRHDEREVRYLVGALRASGYPDVWLDRAELRLGQNWWDRILSGIRESAVVILVVSRRWLDADACRAERDYAMATKRTVLAVLTDHFDAGSLPPDLAHLQASSIHDTEEIKKALDDAEPAELPDPLPEPRPMPLGWQMVETAVKTPDLDVDIQSSIVEFLIDKARSPDRKRRQQARRLADEFRGRTDLAQSIRAILHYMLPGRVAVYPVVGAVLGGLALTHLLWVSSVYVFLDSLVDQLTGFARGTARGVLTVNFLLGLTGLVLCGVAVRRHIRTGKVGLGLCLLAILGVVLDSLIMVKWPIAW